MEKIKTLFKRDWNNRRKLLDELNVDFDFSRAIATEKLDGMNCRITVRSSLIVRLEKRRNPTKEQKDMGITEPWYVDANEDANEDKWLYDAVENTHYSTVLKDIPDGEYSCEAIGKNIQGNPLNLDKNIFFIFSVKEHLKRVRFENVPTTFNELKEWLPLQKSKIGNDCDIEGIVWHGFNGEMVKIKMKDFK